VAPWRGPSCHCVHTLRLQLATSAPFCVGFRAIVDFDEHSATLTCSGDEDRSTQYSRRPALVRALRAPTDVIVDLSGLAFADSSVMLDLAVLARRLRARGRKILLRGPQPQVMALIKQVGLHRLPAVRFDGAAPALA
jgi:anti-anti-sigma factor